MRALNSLTFRIFAIFALTLAVLLVMVLMLPHLDARQLRLLDRDEQLKGNLIAHQLETEFEKLPDYDFRWWIRLDRAIDIISPLNPDSQLFLVTTEGRVISSNNLESHLIRNFIGLSNNLKEPNKKIYNNLKMMGPFYVHDNDDGYYLYVTVPVNKLQSKFMDLLFDNPFILLIFTLLISSPVLLWFSWSLAKPARRFRLAADEVAKGNLSERPELEKGSIEFRQTGISFNKMINDLNRMMSHQQRLISDISHELRTPLTRLKLASALMRRRVGESNELERIENEAQRLDEMISELLKLARLQYSQQNHEYTVMTANDIWREVIDNARFEAEQLHKRFSVVGLDVPYKLVCNAKVLSSALENIIRNAFRYSGNHISIIFRYENGGIIIQVDDDGPGVSEHDLPNIFQPFYRTDEARARISGGTGLGLAIVDAAITQHGGHVNASRSYLGGFCVKLWLPIYKAK